MLTASDLLKQGRNEDLWQMCCGFLDLDINQFMEIQERLLIDQLQRLNSSKLGKKLFRGKKPENMEEFRRLTQLTSYRDYLPELSEKQVDALPGKPEIWAHSSGWSGEFKAKWVPLTEDYIQTLSRVLYGIGMISCSDRRGDSSRIPKNIKILYSVAPRPYISGTFADVLRRQSPITYLPSLEEAETMTYEERIRTGFQQAVTRGLDYFFGLSFVLASVGDKFCQSTKNFDIRPYLKHPRMLLRMSKALVKSKLAGRQILPKDVWSIKGIIGSGVDSHIYKDKVKELWGRYPLDLYSCTEGGVIAVQAWDYDGMSFIPNLNFLEFLPEDEQIKLEMDRTYIPKTLLLNEVKAGENYEIVISSFHGGSLVRYRIGDMIHINSLSNKNLGIALPQMSFERRVDDYIDMYVVRLTEKKIWQAIEQSGVPYQDWVVFKDKETRLLNISIELKKGVPVEPKGVARAIYESLMQIHNEETKKNNYDNQLMDISGLGLKVDLLPEGTFANYIALRQAEGADLAHIKQPHVNPSPKVIAALMSENVQTVIINEPGAGGEENSFKKVLTP